MAKANGGKKGASVQPQKEPNKPAHEIRIGRIKATAWKNTTIDGSKHWFSVTLTRTYKDGEVWKSASSYGVDDLLVAAQVLTAMRWWIAREFQKGPNGGAERQPGDEAPATDPGHEEIPF